jgi:hypothetical protein
LYLVRGVGRRKCLCWESDREPISRRRKGFLLQSPAWTSPGLKRHVRRLAGKMLMAGYKAVDSGEKKRAGPALCVCDLCSHTDPCT